MATSPSAVSGLPAGYTLEQPSTPQPQQGKVSGLPAGYTLETGNQPSTQTQTADVDPSTISTGGEGSNTDQQLMSDASQSDATKKGLIIGGTGAAAVGGLAAGPLIAAGTAGPALVDAAGEPIVHATKAMLQQFGENYPELTKLATKLGFKIGEGGSTLAAWELLKHITAGKK